MPCSSLTYEVRISLPPTCRVGGTVLRVEHQLVVDAALDHPAQAECRIAFDRIACEHQAQVEPADLQRRSPLAGRVGVADLDLARQEARRHRAGLGLGIGLGDTGTLQHRGEHDELVARVGRHVEGRRRSVLAGNVEHQAIGQHAVRTGDRDLAERSDAASSDSDMNPHP
jgi:hypothetical protein